MDAYSPVQHPFRLTTQTFSPAAGIAHTIRVVTISGEPWFVTHDVCRALGLGTSSDGSVDTWRATRGLAATEKMSLPPCTPHLTRGAYAREFGKKASNIGLISEAGLYKLVMRSDSEHARKFQDWVTRDVLPTIRKTGSYVMGEVVAVGCATRSLVGYWNGLS